MRLTISNTKEAALLFLGDISILAFSLWATLFLRYFEVPSRDLFVLHAIPFTFLFAVWFVVFFIAGLYDKHTLLFKEKLPSTILYTQISNIIIAALFFFFVPYFGITPKTNLVIYLMVSFTLIVVWRLWLFERCLQFLGGGRRQRALLIGSGPEIEELKQEDNNNSRYPFEFAFHVRPDDVENSVELQGKLLSYVSAGEVSVIVGDSWSPAFGSLTSFLSNLAFIETQAHFIDSTALYENIFDRIPLSLIHSNWFLENGSTTPQHVFDFIKRSMDILAGLMLTFVAAVVYLFVAIFIKLDDGGPIFFIAERVGKDNSPLKLFKFRSMSLTEAEKVTAVGHYLRKFRIDELPQSWNLLIGDVSLIGPRPESPRLVQHYAERIEHYNVRHRIKPGLSGWAQIKEYDVPRRNVVDIERTRNKLSYDLYYIKNRSLMLDVHIALKTIKTLVSRSGT